MLFGSGGFKATVGSTAHKPLGDVKPRPECGRFFIDKQVNRQQEKKRGMGPSPW